MVGIKVESLDTGLGRLSEFHVSLLLPTCYTEEQLRNAAYALVLKHPETNHWTDVLRRRLFALHAANDDYGFFACRHNSQSMQSVLPSYDTGSDIVSLSSEPVDRLFKNWDSIKQALCQRLLTIRAVLFEDGTALRIKVQHVLCDASGLYTIVQSYASLLSEYNSPHISKVAVPKLHREYRLRQPQGPSQSLENGHNHELSSKHDHYYARGLNGLIAAGLRSWTYARKQRSHSKRTVFISPARFQNWSTSTGQARVTENDILMGWLHHGVVQYSRAFKLDLSDRELFAFVMSINASLETSYDFGNPYLLVPVPTTLPREASIVDYASQIRATLNEARKPKFCQAGIDFHKNLHRVPLIPAHHGTNKSIFVFATSWLRQQWYDIPFPTSAGSTCTASYVQGTIELMPILRAIQIRMPNEIACWKGKNGGFWVEGELPDDLWDVLLRSGEKVAA